MLPFVQELHQHLQGQLGLEEVLKVIREYRAELGTHRKDVLSMLTGLPDFMIASERDEWTQALESLEQETAEAERLFRERSAIQRLADYVEKENDNVAALALRVREAAWSGRGPSSHPGANELLHLMETFLDDSSDQSHQLLMMRIELELTRFDHQAEALNNLPEFLADVMEELLNEYQGILEAVAQLEELEDDALDGLFEQLEEWATSYTAYDVDYLSKRYSQVPTAIPAVNLALNCQMLLLEEIVTEDMVEHTVNLAIDTLNDGSESFLSEQQMSEVERHAYQDCINSIIADLEAMLDLEDAEALRAHGGKLVQTVGKLTAIQANTETMSGSRLDYKSEA